MQELRRGKVHLLLVLLCIVVDICTAITGNCANGDTLNCYVDLSNQNLTQFPPSLPTTTRVLNLAGNRIGGMFADYLVELTSLRELKLDGNPLHCDCNLRWLHYAAINKYQLFENLRVSGAVCQTPESVAGRELSSLSVDDFICQDNVRGLRCYTCGFSTDKGCSNQSPMMCPAHQDRCKTLEFLLDGVVQLQQLCATSSECPDAGQITLGECPRGRDGTCATQCCQGDMCNLFLPRDPSPRIPTTPNVPSPIRTTTPPMPSTKQPPVASTKQAPSSLATTPSPPSMARTTQLPSTTRTTQLPSATRTTESRTTTRTTKPSPTAKTSESPSTARTTESPSTTRTTESPVMSTRTTASVVPVASTRPATKPHCHAELTADDKGIIEWPKTEANNDVTIFRICPYGRKDGGNDFMVERQCLFLSPMEAEWSDPDTSGCIPESQSSKDDRFKKIANMTLQSEQAKVVSRYLNTLTSEADSFDADDMATSVDIVDNILNSQVNGTDLGVAENVLQVVDNLLNVGDEVLAESNEKYDTASRLLIAVEQVSRGILVYGNESVTLETGNISLTVVAIDGSDFEGLEFGIYSADSAGDKVAFSRSEELSKNNLQSEIHLPPSLLENLKPEEQSRIATAQFISYRSSALFEVISVKTLPPTNQPSVSASNDTFSASVLSGPVIAASIGDLKITNLEEPVVITFKQATEDRYVNPKCVFWNFSENEGNGGWSGSGCTVSTNDSNSENAIIVCHCNHLTHFALLMDIYGEADDIDSANHKALTLISYIGCGISLLALSLTLLNFICCWRRKDKQAKIMVNLCFALLMTLLLFLVNAFAVDFAPIIPELCTTLAVLLHYFALAVFIWMALEAVHMYLLLIRIFKTYISHFMTKFCLIGWGVPLIITGVTVAVDTKHYGYYSMFCWLSRYPFYGAFLAPLCLILIFNTIVYCLVIHKICGLNSKVMTANERFDIKAQLRAAIGLMVLLGLTWIFAIFAVGEARLLFSYLFAIFNCLQGLFIFIFHCLLNKEVQKRWRRHCACHKAEYDTKESKRKSLSSSTAERYQISITDQTSFRLDSTSITPSTTEYNDDNEDLSTFRHTE